MSTRVTQASPFLFLAIAALASGCTNAEGATPSTGNVDGPTGVSSVGQTVRLHVEELTCEGCAVQIREILQAVAGVEGVQTDVRQKAVTVEYDATRVTLAELTAALAKDTYTATPIGDEPAPMGDCTTTKPVAADAAVVTMKLPIEGMTCAACVGRVKQALGDLNGVRKVEVRLAQRDALVELVEEAVSADCLRRTIADLGYTVGAPAVVAR